MYNKPGSSGLNGKVERSYCTDKEEFYQFREYNDDVDIDTKLQELKFFYNLHRYLSFYGGFKPYEELKVKLDNNNQNQT